MALPSLRPAQKNVAGRLHKPLSNDHTLALIVISALPGMSFEDRRAGFLELKHQGMVFFVEKQPDEAARADAANTYHLKCKIFQVVAIQQLAALIGKRLPIVSQSLA